MAVPVFTIQRKKWKKPTEHQRENKHANVFNLSKALAHITMKITCWGLLDNSRSFAHKLTQDTPPMHQSWFPMFLSSFFWEKEQKRKSKRKRKPEFFQGYFKTLQIYFKCFVIVMQAMQHCERSIIWSRGASEKIIKKQKRRPFPFILQNISCTMILEILLDRLPKSKRLFLS